MRKVYNPFRNTRDYFCFGCCPDNLMGLKLEFAEEGNEIVSEWLPANHFQGYNNILHGGIQAALMDEIAYWTICVKLKTGAVTAKFDLSLRKPVLMNAGKIILRAKLSTNNRKLAKVNVKLLDSKNEVCAVGIITFYLFSHEEAVKKLNFPSNPDTFFNPTSS